MTESYHDKAECNSKHSPSLVLLRTSNGEPKSSLDHDAGREGWMKGEKRDGRKKERDEETEGGRKKERARKR